MRIATLAIIAVAGSAIAFPAAAQQPKAAPSEQTKEEMHRDVDKGLKASEPNEQMQRSPRPLTCSGACSLIWISQCTSNPTAGLHTKVCIQRLLGTEPSQRVSADFS
jgi:hypothetical protein